jgi:PAS domain S-box-containing protein
MSSMQNDVQRFILESLPVAVAVMSVEGTVWYANPPLLRLFGLSAEATEAPPIEVCGDPTERRQVLDRLNAQGYLRDYELPLRRLDGTPFPARLSLVPIRFDGRSALLCSIVDLGDRQRVAAEIQELNTRLKAQAAALEAANQEFSHLVHAISHDLKAPLRGVDGYSLLLLEDFAEPLGPEGQLFLRNIRNAGQQMGQMIDGLLNFSRLERQPLAVGAIDLRELVDRVADERASDLQARAIDLQVTLPTGLIVSTDRAILTIAIWHLLDNAIKFIGTAAAPRVEIGGRRDPHGCLLWLRDNGPGFDLKFHSRIFGIFQRLHRPEDCPGAGVGLAIVHKAMQRLGGRVWAESAPGQGATFYLEIPA